MPAGDLFVNIGKSADLPNGTEYGSTGLNVLRSFSLEPGGPSQRGLATITIAKLGGIFTFLNKQHVQVYVNIGAAYRSLFGGVIDDIKINQQQESSGNFFTTYTITCVDYNFLLDGLVNLAGAAISDGGDQTFEGHVTRICRYVTTLDYTTCTFDTSGNGLSGTYSSGSGFRTLARENTDGKKLRDMLQIECNHYQQDINAAVSPRFWFSPPVSCPAGGWTNGEVLLNIVDGNINPTPTYHFHDGSGAGLTLFKVQQFGRVLNSPKQFTRVDAKGNVGDTVYIDSTLADNTTRTNYPNPWDARVISGVTQNAWNAPPIDVGAVATHAQIQAAADKFIAGSKNPRETIPFTVLNSGIDPAQMMPGFACRITWTVYGLSGVDYRIAQTKITAIRDTSAVGGMNLVYSVQAGLKILELGESGGVDATVAPVIGYHIQPQPPTVLTKVRDWFGGPPSYADLSWVPSVTPGCKTIIRWHQGLRTYWSPPMDSTITTHTIAVTPGMDYTINAYAIDQFGNASVDSNTVTGTGATYPDDDSLYNGAFAILSSEDATQPDGWTPSGTGTGVIVQAPSSPNTAQALKLTCIGAQTKVYRSRKVIALNQGTALGNQFALAVRVTYYATSNKGFLNIGVEWYDKTTTLVTTTYLPPGHVAPLAATVKTLSAVLYAPAGTVEALLFVGYDGSVTSGTESLTIAACSMRPAQMPIGQGAGAIAVDDTEGWLAIPTMPGNPTGVPDIAAGAAALVVDTNDSRLDIYQSAETDAVWLGKLGASYYEPILLDGTPLILGTDILVIGV